MDKLQWLANKEKQHIAQQTHHGNRTSHSGIPDNGTACLTLPYLQRTRRSSVTEFVIKYEKIRWSGFVQQHRIFLHCEIKMEAAHSFETSITICQSTRCNVPDDFHLHHYRGEKLNNYSPYKIVLTLWAAFNRECTHTLEVRDWSFLRARNAPFFLIFTMKYIIPHISYYSYSIPYFYKVTPLRISDMGTRKYF